MVVIAIMYEDDCTCSCVIDPKEINIKDAEEILQFICKEMKLHSDSVDEILLVKSLDEGATQYSRMQGHF